MKKGDFVHYEGEVWEVTGYQPNPVVGTSSLQNKMIFTLRGVTTDKYLYGLHLPEEALQPLTAMEVLALAARP